MHVFLINAHTCELGFQHLFMPLWRVRVASFGEVYRRSQILPLGRGRKGGRYFTVSTGGGMERFVPMVMVVDRRDATSVLGVLKIFTSYSQLLPCAVCQLDENDS
jgi:hypothetical protein